MPCDFHATLVEFSEIAPDVRHFVLSTAEPFEFTPGQFVYVYADAGANLRRAYSIASAPRGREFELCLNRVREGIFSPYLFEQRPGAVLHVKGPFGVFGWRSPARDAVLVATGTGITPFRAMLQAGLPAVPERRVTLLFGVRHQRAILFQEEFERMQDHYPQFRFLPTLTRPEPGWRGMTGRVQQHLDHVLAPYSGPDVYVCGLHDMIGEVREILLLRGFDRHRVIYERYD